MCSFSSWINLSLASGAMRGCFCSPKGSLNCKAFLAHWRSVGLVGWSNDLEELVAAKWSLWRFWKSCDKLQVPSLRLVKYSPMVVINSFSSYHGIVGSSPFCGDLASQTVLLQTAPLQKNSSWSQKLPVSSLSSHGCSETPYSIHCFLLVKCLMLSGCHWKLGN